MKVLRYFTLICLMSIVVILQACGGGGKTDTAGALVLSSPTLTSNGDGSYKVSATVTYTPPAGKSAQGVVVTTTASDNFGIVGSSSDTYTSGTSAFTYSYYVPQLVGASNYVSIVSNIGDMKSAVSVPIPAIVAMSAAPIDFLTGEAVPPGTTKTTTISGGVGAYTLTSANTVGGVLTISLAGSTLTVKYINSSPATNPTTTQVVIRDASGSYLNIPVSYY